MKDLRDELLEYLFQHSGEMVDILFIVKRKVNVDNDGICTQEDINRLLSVNVVLRELERMDWINCYPKGGIMTASTGVPTDPNKRKLLWPISLQARMTTNGELEYKKLKKEEQQPPSVTNIQNIGNNSGVAIQGSDFSEANFLPNTNPIITPNVEQNNTAGKMSLWTKLKKEVWSIVIGVIIILIGAYIVWKLGWV